MIDRPGSPAPPDPLGEALHFLRMEGTFYCRSELSAPWGMELPPMNGCLWFHVVTHGRAWLRVAGGEPIALRPGDLVLIPHGSGHVLYDEPDSATPDVMGLDRQEVSERYEILRHGGGGAPCGMVCGAVSFGHPAAADLVALLPGAIHLEPDDSPHAAWIQSTLQLMAAEARALRPGGETIVTRLSDVLVIQAIRSWLDAAPEAQTGWLGALQDPQIGRAIAAVHRDPARDWTLASLAAEVAMSRSAFAARFTALVGEPAMTYVARWRMNVATAALRDEGASVGELAVRLGYGSEAAFARAFKRVTGETPGALRRAA